MKKKESSGIDFVRGNEFYGQVTPRRRLNHCHFFNTKHSSPFLDYIKPNFEPPFRAFSKVPPLETWSYLSKLSPQPIQINPYLETFNLDSGPICKFRIESGLLAIIFNLLLIRKKLPIYRY